MEKKLPSSTKVVVIGGGVVGCSVAYHLAKFGWKDTILLERDQLTSGTTWHAAGLVSQLGPSAGVTKIRKYSLELYKKLEKELDFSSGLKLNGALSIATTKGRWQELKRQATTAQLFDVNVEILNIDQIKRTYPIINDENILGGIFMPGDGQADPIGVTQLLAKAARKEGAKIFEKSPVEKIIKKNGRVAGVIVNDQTIECEYVVLATGMWSRQIGEDTGFSIPLYPAEHFYVITEGISDLPKNIPVLRDFDDCLYLKEDAGKKVLHTGDLGTASILKVITNYLASVHLAALGEAWTVAKKSNLDLNKTFKGIAVSSGNSFVHETESQVILNGSYNINFTMDLVKKDINLFNELSKKLNTPLEISPFVLEIFKDAQKKYGSRAWSSMVVKRLEDKFNLNFRAPGFPDELVDNEKEEKGYEI